MISFRTHTGEIVEGARCQAAFNRVSDDWRQLAFDIRAEDAYADHVTEDEKDADFKMMLYEADLISRGEFRSFTIWQRVNQVLTGVCVALLP